LRKNGKKTSYVDSEVLIWALALLLIKLCDLEWEKHINYLSLGILAHISFSGCCLNWMTSHVRGLCSDNHLTSALEPVVPVAAGERKLSFNALEFFFTVDPRCELDWCCLGRWILDNTCIFIPPSNKILWHRIKISGLGVRRSLLQVYLYHTKLQAH
jgi:hypothetical protein